MAKIKGWSTYASRHTPDTKYSWQSDSGDAIDIRKPRDSKLVFVIVNNRSSFFHSMANAKKYAMQYMRSHPNG